MVGNFCVVGTLPEGYRPAGRLVFHCEWSGDRDGVRLDVLPDGRIFAANGIGPGQWVSLSGISFPVE